MGNFWYPISAMEEGVVRQHELGNICRSGLKRGESPRSCSNWGLWWGRRGDWYSCWSSCHCIFRHSWIQSFSHGLIWWLWQHVLQRHWRSPEKFQQGNPPLPLICHVLGWIFYPCAEKKEHPPKPIRNTKHECRLSYNNVHTHILFLQSMRTYSMAEAINIQFFQNSPQTINPEHKCKITSYDRINQS